MKSGAAVAARLAFCLAVALVGASCSVSPRSGAAPSGILLSTAGRVVDALTQAGISGVDISADGLAGANSDAGGAFSVSATASSNAVLMTFRRSAFVTRVTYVKVPGPSATVSLIPSSFDLAAFDEMCRPQGLLRWTSAPPLAIETRTLKFSDLDEATPLVLAEDMTTAEFDGVAGDLTWALPQLTGNQFTGFAGVARQSSAEGGRVGVLVTGRITVAVYAGLTAATGFSGYSRWQFRSDGTITGGTMMLDRDFVKSPGSFERSVLAHELGHTLGYNHVTSRASVMNAASNLEPNDFDRDAARIVFQRPPGNRSPDTDPAGFSTNAVPPAATWSAAVR